MEQEKITITANERQSTQENPKYMAHNFQAFSPWAYIYI